MKLFNNTFIYRFIFIGSVFFMASCHNKSAENKMISNKETGLPSIPSHIDTATTLKKKNILAYIQTADKIKPNVKNGFPFDKLDYDKIIAYDFQGNEDDFTIIDEKGEFNNFILKQQFLTQEQADKILSGLTKNSTYGEGTAACFQPHLALLFFKENKKINEIDICLDCNYLSSDIEIPAETHKILNKGTENEYALTGFTDSGKELIKSLCKELNFHYKQY